ncbi:relA-associated inhibitor [Pholidichthys leucotaenia]
MNSQTSFGSSMLFQAINDDLSASLATADELSREFDSLLKEASSNDNNTESEPQTISTVSREKPHSSWSSTSSVSIPVLSFTSTNDSPTSTSYSSTSFRRTDSSVSSSSNRSSSPDNRSSPHSSPRTRRARSPLLPSPSHPQHSSRLSKKQNPLPHFDGSPRNSISYIERSRSPVNLDQPARSPSVQTSSSLLSPYDNTQMGRRSPRPDRSPSPLSFNHPMSSTLPRNFQCFRHSDEGVRRPKIPSKWSETDLDVSYEKKPRHTYDKTEWLRPTVPNSNWRESNLDGPSPSPSPKKDQPNPLQHPHSSLPCTTRSSAPPDVSSPAHSPYSAQPIISRISIPPASAPPSQHKPIPLSVIMRLQNPRWGAVLTRDPQVIGGKGDMPLYQPTGSIPREYFQHLSQLHKRPPELTQPVIYSDVLIPGDVDAELDRLDRAHHLGMISENPSIPEGGEKCPLRPLSPTKLQPVVAPEAQGQVVPDVEELLRLRAEIPRPLKRQGSVDHSVPLKKASHYQPNQYKNLINKLFRRKDRRSKGEKGSESSSSSDGEEAATPPAPLPKISTVIPHEKGYFSILRRSGRDHKNSGKHARLSPLVLLLDGALVGEVDTVQKAVQEMSDPSQPNDEGITGLHNAICGGHYNVVDFLVRIGANVSAPDSHGWTPLHCAASCNDRLLCEFLVRNGAAVMAFTESDGATASQKCDPYAPGYEECEAFLKGVEEAMGVENSGVLYALWSYPAQAPDELSFKDGDMITILQKPEGSDWWWASLCGREGFVPNNYFGLFPKVRPKSLC